MSCPTSLVERGYNRLKGSVHSHTQDVGVVNWFFVKTHTRSAFPSLLRHGYPRGRERDGRGKFTSREEGPGPTTPWQRTLPKIPPQHSSVVVVGYDGKSGHTLSVGVGSPSGRRGHGTGGTEVRRTEVGSRGWETTRDSGQVDSRDPRTLKDGEKDVGGHVTVHRRDGERNLYSDVWVKEKKRDLFPYSKTFRLTVYSRHFRWLTRHLLSTQTLRRVATLTPVLLGTSAVTDTPGAIYYRDSLTVLTPVPSPGIRGGGRRGQTH